MSEPPDDRTEFDRVRDRAADAISEEDIASVYVGLVHDDERNEFYFANDVDEAELREMATRQLGMMARVLADQSEASVEEITELAADAAKELDLRG